jgi:hypothetical protein
MAHRLTRSLVALFLVVASCGTCWALEFCADLKSNVGGEPSKGKIFVKGNYIRMDFKENGKTMMTMLAQNGSSTVWYYDSDLKIYWSYSREVPYNLLNTKTDCAQWRGVDCGFEKINGMKCRKVSYPIMGGKETRWYSEKLKVPIKIEEERLNKHFTLQYYNIKQCKQSEEVFMIPGGYENREPDYWKKYHSISGD